MTPAAAVARGAPPVEALELVDWKPAELAEPVAEEEEEALVVVDEPEAEEVPLDLAEAEEPVDEAEPEELEPEAEAVEEETGFVTLATVLVL